QADIGFGGFRHRGPTQHDRIGDRNRWVHRVEVDTLDVAHLDAVEKHCAAAPEAGCGAGNAEAQLCRSSLVAIARRPVDKAEGGKDGKDREYPYNDVVSSGCHTVLPSEVRAERWCVRACPGSMTSPRVPRSPSCPRPFLPPKSSCCLARQCDHKRSGDYPD